VKIRTRWWWAIIPVVAAVLGPFLVPRPALAVMDILQADGSPHDYCLTSGFTTQPALAHTAMGVLDSTTDFTIVNRGTCSGTRSSSLVDVWWYEMDLPGNTRGEEQCMKVIPGSSEPFLLPSCQTADVRIDYVQLDIGDDDPQDREKTAVHEVGHSVGLGHHTHVCAMRTGGVPDATEQWRRYHAADIAMINDNY
jgi:hypothetical protein